MFKKNKNRFLIKTPTGYETFKGVQKKIVDSMYTITLEDDTYLKCSGNHALLTESGFKLAREITEKNTVSNKIIKSIIYEIGSFEVYDPVGVDKHSTYLSNNIVSHNTEFLGSTNTLISGSKLQALVYNDPLERMKIAKEEILDVYEHPVKGDDETMKDHTYAICVDVAEGKNMDCSAFSVIDVSETPYKQVARYNSAFISPVLFPTIIYNSAKYYNDAYVLIEVNNTPQIADILHGELEYENLLKVQTGNKKAQQITAGFGRGVQLGLKMSNTVKRIGCTNLKTLIESDKLLLQDFDTISELTSFISDGITWKAEEGKNDDITMTLVMFAWLTTQKYFKDVVDHDLRKQLQLEKLNQMDDETVPGPIIDNGLDVPFLVEDGDVWVTGDGDVYADYFSQIMKN